MKRGIQAFSGQKFDLAVIGGGVQGAATAREAALRGLKVALVEAGDFSSGTSSRSSKLIHGGLRYLGQLDFKLVRESRRERQLLQKLAPHLACPIPFVLPIYRGDPYFPLRIRLGLSIYDLMGNLGKEDRHRMLDRDGALELAPGLRPEGLRAAAVYHDSLTDDSRLTVENIVDAAEHGAVVANYAEVCALAVSGKMDGAGTGVTSADVEDKLTGRKVELAARFWVNAAGPWVDHVRGLLPKFDGSRTVRLTKGTHLIVPPVLGSHALLAPVEDGKAAGRVFLMVPWHGQALLGTTDTDYHGDPARVAPDDADTEYLLRAANRVLRLPLSPADVRGSWAGVRALVVEPGRSPSANTREYRFHEDSWATNLVSICGGKLTTSRALAEKLVDRIADTLGVSTAGRESSRTVPLPGGQTGAFEPYADYAAWEAVRLFDIPFPAADRIVRTYGSRWRKVLEPIKDDPSLARPLPGSPTLMAAEVVFAIREEMALSPEDFLLRRSGLSWASCLVGEAAPAVADIFSKRFQLRTHSMGAMNTE